MRRTAARSILARMTRFEVETDTSIVEKNPRITGNDVGTEVQSVGLSEGDAQALSVDNTEMCGVSVGRQRHTGPGSRNVISRDSGAVGIDRIRPEAQSVR